MKINRINSFNPTIKGKPYVQKNIEIQQGKQIPQKVYTFKYNSEKGIINLISNIPGAMDAICWYTLNKDGIATSQSCWSPVSDKTQSNKFKKLYEELLAETQNGTKELSQERQEEIIEEIYKHTKNKKAH